MSELNSLEQSEEMVAKIVAHLAQNGVQPTTFGVDELACKLSNNDQQLFESSVSWLLEEGILRPTQKQRFIDDSDDPAKLYAFQFVLTAKGYQLLAAKFTGTLTLGQAIAQVSGPGGKYSSIGDLMGGILGGFTKSLGSGG